MHMGINENKLNVETRSTIKMQLQISLLTYFFICSIVMKRSGEINDTNNHHKKPYNDNLIKRKHLFEINNNDNYCLFYAIELMRFYSLYKRRIITESRWRWLNENQTTKLKEKVIILLHALGIPLEEPDYDANDYINTVQQFWNYKYPGEYKIFIFNDYHSYPITKSDVIEYQFPILLYHNDNHFDGIKTISKFLGTPYYCLSCEKTYTHKTKHSMSCSSLCFGCREVGPDYPCDHQQSLFL